MSELVPPDEGEALTRAQTATETPAENGAPTPDTETEALGENVTATDAETGTPDG